MRAGTLRLPFLGLALLVVGGAAVWLLARMPETGAGADSTSDAATTAPPSTGRSPRAEAAVTPGRRLATGETLSLASDALPSEGDLSLALELPDEARGEGPRDARLVAPDGRELKTTATPLPGAGSGVRLEIDPRWLRPGRYLIEVQTAEHTHFPLRRYVLEIR